MLNEGTELETHAEKKKIEQYNDTEQRKKQADELQ